jgi:molybdate transport system regulatory protein
MQLSTRNQLQAVVTSVELGDIMAIVKVELGDGQAMTAVITREAVESLSLRNGSAVLVLVKSTEVMLATE